MAGMIVHFSQLRPADAARLEDWLGDHRGVSSAIADPEAKTVFIMFDPTLTVEMKLREELERRGFQVTGVEEAEGEVSPNQQNVAAETGIDDRMLSSQRKAELGD